MSDLATDAAAIKAVGHVLVAMEDDMGKVGRLLKAIGLAAAGLQTRDEADALVELAVSTRDLLDGVKEARTAGVRLTLSDTEAPRLSFCQFAPPCPVAERGGALCRQVGRVHMAPSA